MTNHVTRTSSVFRILYHYFSGILLATSSRYIKRDQVQPCEIIEGGVTVQIRDALTSDH
jgi:hypothetical protein